MHLKRFLSVAGVVLCLETEQALTENEAFLPFLIPDTHADHRAIFTQVEKLPLMPQKTLSNDSAYRVCVGDDGVHYRFFFDSPDAKQPYAAAFRDESDGSIRVEYLGKYGHCVAELQNAFFHIGFENLMINENRLCLHAACVETPLGGILFSGVSGIGKSTQAELWCKHREARQINGDRPILGKTEDGWQAWGSPYAGSSKCYVNDNCPVTAIIMLKQAEDCALRRLSVPEAFRAVWSGVTVHTWDTAFVNAACDLVVELIGSVPVFEFACTPDERAVEYLEQYLRKECGL